jgi:hypothetical protein
MSNIKLYFILAHSPAQPCRISTFWGQKTLGYLIEICQFHVNLIAIEFGKISNFGQLTPRQLHPRQSRAKMMRLFTFLAILMLEKVG